MLDHLLDGGAACAQIVAGIEDRGLLHEGAAERGGHGHANVGVDVDLTNGHGGSLAELLLGDAHCVGHCAAVLVDLGYELLRHRGCAVEHDGEAGETMLDLLQNVKAQRRGNQNALLVAGALLGGELVSTVRGTDGDGEGVNAGAGDEVLHLLGTGVGGVLGHHVVLNAGQNAQLALDHHAVSVRVLHDLLGQSDIVLVAVVRAVDHDGGEAAVDAGLADLEVCAVIQVQSQIDAAVLDGGLSQSHQILMLGVLARACGYLENNGGLDLTGSLGDGLDDLHVVDVEGTDGVAALVGLLEHFLGCYECHIL